MRKILLFAFILSLLLGCSRNDQTKEWYTFEPNNRREGSILGMADWLDAPAGKHGFLTYQGEDLLFEDLEPVKFWGVNICNARVAPDDSLAEYWAGQLAHFGVNCVRFHKFTWHGKTEGIGSATRSTRLNEDRARQWDHFVNSLKERGIYTGWSHIYGHRPRPADSSRVMAYDEIMEAHNNHLKGSTYGLVNFARDLQDLNIELTVNMLERTNPYTGTRYADDPSLAFIELQNEDNIFWPSTLSAVNQCPSYKKEFCRQFSQWLKDKYGNHESLVKAWGKEALNAYPEFQEEEHLDSMNIYPIAHEWYYSPEGLQDQEEKRGTRRRLLDNALFLYETQKDFYNRFIRAIRETGYQGIIVGSCWQAGSGITHYYNLHADYRAGMIDRHNYFGGGTGHRLVPGKVNNQAMVNNPGSGLLSSGFQQVVDRPFSLSEWISKLPNEWIVEGTPIIAIYGLGLQGWDASFQFANDGPDYTNTLDSRTVYNINAPTQMGLYPVLARMIYRGDVKEGKIVARRYVHVPSLAEGKIGFGKKVKQEGDNKSISGDLSPEILAAGRIVLDFFHRYKESEVPDLSEYIDEEKQVIFSSTAQLNWHYGDSGYFTLNTPGTQGVVGFSGKKILFLEDVTLRTENPFSAVFVASLDKSCPIRHADSVLVVTLARTRNDGMKYSPAGDTLLKRGSEPILVEPVRTHLKFNNKIPSSILPLDHDGIPTGKIIDVQGEELFLDGRAYRTMYYLVRFKEDWN